MVFALGCSAHAAMQGVAAELNKMTNHHPRISGSVWKTRMNSSSTMA
jgi:hypothetical protein